MIVKLRRYLSRLYIKGVDAMHRPFVKRGAEDPYHAVFAEFISLTRQARSPSLLEIF
jgi:hypothetical protein